MFESRPFSLVLLIGPSRLGRAPEPHVATAAPLRLAAVALLVALAASSVAAQPAPLPLFEAELELGAAWQARNVVEIPNDGTATRFSLRDLAGRGPWPAGRVHLTWNVTDRHGLRLLLAPLSYTETGAFDEPQRFAGATYLAGVPTEATYRFDSWRLTYRYRFKSGERWNWWVGFTAKVRDAEIDLSQPGAASRDTDLGFVPLLHLRGDWRFSDRWHFLVDLDALAGGPGRAEDLALKLAYDLRDDLSISFGFRTLEGGADVDEVYNFAWFNHAVVSASYRWGTR